MYAFKVTYLVNKFPLRPINRRKSRFRHKLLRFRSIDPRHNVYTFRDCSLHLDEIYYLTYYEDYDISKHLFTGP